MSSSSRSTCGDCSCRVIGSLNDMGLSNLEVFLHHLQGDDVSQCFLLGFVLTYMQMVDGSSWSSATIFQIGLDILCGFSLDFSGGIFFARVKYTALTSVVIDSK